MSHKSGPKYACCGLFDNKPSELPMFCPPTASWCKFEANGGPAWSGATVKKTCCGSFGEDLGTKCGTHQPAAPPQPIGGTKPKESISQAIGLAIRSFELVINGDKFNHGFVFDENKKTLINDTTVNGGIACFAADCGKIMKEAGQMQLNML